jgi:hypothetical protein
MHARSIPMGWTDWRLIAESHEWFASTFNHDGPACYELSIAGPRGGDRRTVYVGETKSESTRIAAYASHGSHLSAIIDAHLREGWTLWYRGVACNSKAAAKRMQDNLLTEYDYPWNLQLNSDDGA